MEENGAGGVIITSNFNELVKWVKYSLNECEPSKHGKNYIHTFYCKKIRDLSICFYIIDGYSTLSENLAFEHAFFVIEDFLGILGSDAPSEYLAFADVGNEIEDNEFIGFESFDKSLSFFKTSLSEIRSLRNAVIKEGDIIWQI